MGSSELIFYAKKETRSGFITLEGVLGENIKAGLNRVGLALKNVNLKFLPRNERLDFPENE